RGQIARGAHQRAGRVVDAGPRAGLEAARVALEVPDDPADRHRLVDLHGGHAARAARRVQHLDRAGSGVGRPRLQPDVGRVELARLRERGELRGRYLRTAVEAGDAVGDATVGPLDTAEVVEGDRHVAGLAVDGRDRARAAPRLHLEDRKSTRLNSSHV